MTCCSHIVIANGLFKQLFIFIIAVFLRCREIQERHIYKAGHDGYGMQDMKNGCHSNAFILEAKSQSSPTR